MSTEGRSSSSSSSSSVRIGKKRKTTESPAALPAASTSLLKEVDEASKEKHQTQQPQEITEHSSNQDSFDIKQPILENLDAIDSTVNSAKEALDSINKQIQEAFKQEKRICFSKATLKHANVVFPAIDPTLASHFMLSPDDFVTKVLDADAAACKVRLFTDAPAALHQSVIDTLQKEMSVLGVHWEARTNEATLNEFIKAILQNVVYFLQKNEIELLFQGDEVKASQLHILHEKPIQVKGIRYHGPVEEVVAFGRTLVAVEVTSQSLFDSRIQNLFELYAAWQRNQLLAVRDKAPVDFPIYGIVSTMSRWAFVRYDGRPASNRTPLNLSQSAKNDVGCFLSSSEVQIQVGTPITTGVSTFHISKHASVKQDVARLVNINYASINRVIHGSSLRSARSL